MERLGAILIVDDSMSSVMITKALVKELFPKMEALIAFSEKQAMEIIEQDNANLVCALIDYHLNVVNGHELMEKLSVKIPYAKMALVTSEESSEIKIKTRQMGATYMAKPLKAKQLQKFVMAV